MHPEYSPLKPEDQPADPADELAAYFQTRDYKREVRRQRASHATLVQLDRASARTAGAELRAYFGEGSYAHASHLVDGKNS